LGDAAREYRHAHDLEGLSLADPLLQLHVDPQWQRRELDEFPRKPWIDAFFQAADRQFAFDQE
jgi:hypothetical protein